MLTDLLIIKKIKEGDIRTFEAVFKQYYTPLCLFVTGIIKEHDVAEEIVQEFFYVFWKEKERLTVFHSLKSYFYGAVKNRALQYCEHREVENRFRESIQNGPEDIQTDPQKEIELKELETLLRKTLDKLPARRRNIFRMHRMEGLKYNEIAKKLGVSVKTVEAEITKTLRTFRIELETYYDTND